MYPDCSEKYPKQQFSHLEEEIIPMEQKEFLRLRILVQNAN